MLKALECTFNSIRRDSFNFIVDTLFDATLLSVIASKCIAKKMSTEKREHERARYSSTKGDNVTSNAVITKVSPLENFLAISFEKYHPICVKGICTIIVAKITVRLKTSRDKKL